MKNRIWIYVLMIAAVGSVAGMIKYQWPYISDYVHNKPTTNGTVVNTKTSPYKK